jgi:hypothetical protein
MTRIPRLIVLLAAFVLVVAACGGDDDAGSDADTAAAETTTTAPPETTTTTTAPETTTTAPPETTTTTAPETTTTAAASSPADAQAVVDAKVAAAVAATPDDWQSTPIESDTDAADSDEIYGECAGEGAFDLANLDDATIAISIVSIDGPPSSATFFPPPSASIEARVFESVAVAEEAFGVLETVIGTAEGRDCLVEQFIQLIAEGTPEDAEFDVQLEELTVPGADVGARLVVQASAEGITFAFQFDLVAGLAGDCTVYGTFISFGEPVFDPAVRDAIFAAATSV